MASEPAIHCTLRELRADDAARIASLVNDEAVTRFTARIPYPYAIEDAHAFLADAARKSKPGIQERFAIEVDGDLAGGIGYEPAGTNKNSGVGEGAIEIGYWLGKPYWGQGYATRAVTELVALLAKIAPGRDVVAQVHVDNPASARVLKKCGFIDLGATRCTTPARDTDDVPARFLIRKCRPLDPMAAPKGTSSE